jgi:hypothetical protein
MQSQCDLNNAAANTLERFGILRHATKLHELKFVPEQFLRAIWKILKIPFRVPEPYNWP